MFVLCQSFSFSLLEIVCPIRFMVRACLSRSLSGFEPARPQPRRDKLEAPLERTFWTHCSFVELRRAHFYSQANGPCLNKLRQRHVRAAETPDVCPCGRTRTRVYSERVYLGPPTQGQMLIANAVGHLCVITASVSRSSQHGFECLAHFASSTILELDNHQ